MKSPHYFVIKPLNSKRYDSTRMYDDVEFIMSSSMEDHTVTNRVGIVDSTPIGYDGDISVGDFVIVHHNVFRIYYDMKGNERSSWNHYDEDIFIVELDQIFLYGKDEWKAPYPFCFIEPIENDNSDYMLNTDVEKYLHGHVSYIPQNKDVKTGDLVSFKPESEYEFRIDGKKLYRMKLSSLCLKI